jgi:hypothetical protein
MKNLNLFLIVAGLIMVQSVFAKAPMVILTDKPSDKLITCLHNGAAFYVSPKVFKQADHEEPDGHVPQFNAMLNGKSYEILRQEDQNLQINVKGQEPVEYVCIFSVDVE